MSVALPATVRMATVPTEAAEIAGAAGVRAAAEDVAAAAVGAATAAEVAATVAAADQAADDTNQASNFGRADFADTQAYAG